MPGLARKILVCAAVDGLILLPVNNKKEQRPPPALKIQYGADVSMTAVSRDSIPDSSSNTISSFEAFGVVG
jgi:hypothetical protein